MRTATFITILLLIYSCSRNENRFYDNNNDGRYRKYYSHDTSKLIEYVFDSLNENITSIVIWDNRLKKRIQIDIKDGSLIRIINEQNSDSTYYINFNENLNVKDISFVNQNSIKRYIFDRSSLREIRDLIRTKEDDYTVNERRIYDSKININDKESFYIDHDLPDTISRGKNTKVNLSFRSSGRYKFAFFINNSANTFDSIKATDNLVQLDLNSSDSGRFTFKGIAVLYDTLENRDIEEMNILVNRTYIVK